MLMVLADWPLVLQTLCRRSVTQLPAIILLLRQPYLHSGVHLDGSGAQRDAKWARLHCVIAVRCYSAVALRIGKQIDMGYAVILQRGGKQTTAITQSGPQCRSNAVHCNQQSPDSAFTLFFSDPTSCVPKSHTLVNTLQCGTLIRCSTHLDIGSVVPNHALPCCTFQKSLLQVLFFVNHYFNDKWQPESIDDNWSHINQGYTKTLMAD